MTSIGGANNSPNIYFRLTDTSSTAGGAINGGYVGSTGTSVVDDFTINGDVIPVPEPAAWGAMVGSGLLSLSVWRIWRQRQAAHAF